MVNILIGLFGLGLVIFLHELGHLVAAKMNGVTVEAFSIGWGPRVVAFTRGGTEYRVSWLPIGGYCKMKGEHALLKAWQNRTRTIDAEPGDFYAASPLARIIILLAGPLVNLAFAVLVLGVIAIIGYSIQTFPNRVVLASDFGSAPTVADQSGIRTGDMITAINGDSVETFRDLQIIIGQSAEEQLQLNVVRDSEELRLDIVPEMDPQTGAGRIGVYPWIIPRVAEVAPGSPAAIGGIQPNDLIRSVAGVPVEHSIAVERLLTAAGSRPVDIVIERGGSNTTITVVPGTDESGTARLGVAYETLTIQTPQLGLVGGMIAGFTDTMETLRLTIRGIGLLFSGVDLNQALMGPVRITYMVGEVATAGLSTGIGRGVLSFFNFLSLISVTLFFMNLLPIPVLDGGQIVLSLAELVTRRPIHPRFVYHYQMVGNVLILGLMFFALFNDILFFARG